MTSLQTPRMPKPSTNEAAVYETNLPLPGRRQGKVRDIYSVPARGNEPACVLIVATDRISAFDVVLPTAIPGKGRMLTGISTRWFHWLRQFGIVKDHLISTNSDDIPGLSPEQRREIAGRMMLGRAAEVIPIEFVVRGYLAGSGWKEYEATRSVCGVPLPAGLRRSGRLPEPIFTPATKATEGHDENIDFERACDIAGREVMTRLRDASIDIYVRASRYAEERGIILADTKFEFGCALDATGRSTEELMLIDEVLTPDSSRFWPMDEYEPGREPQSMDKQYVRNYLLELVKSGKWNKTPPGPPLPDEIVRNTYARYMDAHDRLFGG